MTGENSNLAKKFFGTWEFDFKKFTKFTGKHLWWSLLCNKVATWRPALYLKRDSHIDVVLIIFCKSFKNAYFVQCLWTAVSIYCQSISAWKKVFLYSIYCLLIWFYYVRTIKTNKMLLICLQIEKRICYNFWLFIIH